MQRFTGEPKLPTAQTISSWSGSGQVVCFRDDGCWKCSLGVKTVYSIEWATTCSLDQHIIWCEAAEDSTSRQSLGKAYVQRWTSEDGAGDNDDTQYHHTLTYIIYWVQAKFLLELKILIGVLALYFKSFSFYVCAVPISFIWVNLFFFLSFKKMF